MAKYYIGVDFSKSTIDAVLGQSPGSGFQLLYSKFLNSKSGVSELLKWVRGHTGLRGTNLTSQVMFGGENTGRYSCLVSEILAKKGFFVWLADPLDIKRATCGRSRSKTDKADAAMICEYMARNADKAKEFVPLSPKEKEIVELFRRHIYLTQTRTSMKQRNISMEDGSELFPSIKGIMRKNAELIARLDKEIKDNDMTLVKAMKAEPRISRYFEIITSFIGAGPILAAALLTYTQFFRKFNSGFRALTAYAGVCPQKRRSGTSIKGADHVSKQCNRILKGLLSCAATSAMRTNPKIKVYAEGLKDRDKHLGIIKNNVCYKIIKIITRLIETDTLFDPDFDDNHNSKKSSSIESEQNILPQNAAVKENICESENKCVTLKAETEEETGSAGEQPVSNKSLQHTEKSVNVDACDTGTHLFQELPMAKKTLLQI